MSTSQAPKRLHYGWVVVLAQLTFIGSCFWDLTLYPSSEGVLAFACYMTAIITIPAAFILGIWLLIVWLVYASRRIWHGRTWLGLLPSAFMLVSALFHASTYSREDGIRKLFVEYFAVEIPPDAEGMDVSAPTLAYSGNKAFTFRCSKQSTVALIKALKMEPHHQRAPFLSHPLVPDWTDEHWQSAHLYEYVDDEGTQNRLITVGSLESVLITRWPFYTPAVHESDQKHR
ncbi:MAG: hypothetical protein IAE77_27675 [Prosthecobacter sp.]|jgi:hypothetical protein|uniref:hypothetical protein n=1 Tax=Prosthecobacter sp. TaxID=1965333 RepID=UPI0019DAC4DC|nr:hypothetical protein [Prosthecobacter sp.]MBE2287265.1 hypothetical protein [Prosthecobacter sp.]